MTFNTNDIFFQEGFEEGEILDEFLEESFEDIDEYDIKDCDNSKLLFDIVKTQILPQLNREIEISFACYSEYNPIIIENIDEDEFDEIELEPQTLEIEDELIIKMAKAQIDSKFEIYTNKNITNKDREKLYQKIFQTLEEEIDLNYQDFYLNNYRDSLREFRFFAKDIYNVFSVEDFENIYNWHLRHYQNFAINKNRVSITQYRLFATLSYYNLLLINEKYKKNRVEYIELNSLIFEFSSLIIANYNKESKKAFKIIKKFLTDEDFEFLESKIKDFLHIWFIIFLYIDYSESKIDINKNILPKNLNFYDEILKEWKSENLSKIDEMVTKMCDYRMQRCFNAIEDIECDYIFENRLFFLFPFEILVLLQLRKSLNLPNPEKFSHILMNNPLATLPKVKEFLPIPFFKQVIKKYKKESQYYEEEDYDDEILDELEKLDLDEDEETKEYNSVNEIKELIDKEYKEDKEDTSSKNYLLWLLILYAIYLLFK